MKILYFSNKYNPRLNPLNFEWHKTGKLLMFYEAITIHLARLDAPIFETPYTNELRGDKWPFVPTARNIREVALLATSEYKWSSRWNFQNTRFQFLSFRSVFLSRDRLSLMTLLIRFFTALLESKFHSWIIKNLT